MDKVYKCLGASNHSKEEREKDDFYSTPNSVTIAATRWLKKNIPECVDWKIWEPAAGNGRMIEALKDAEMNVVAMSDIVDRGYSGVVLEDFLNATEMKDDSNCIFTNPPYKLATEFLDKFLQISKDGDYYIFLGRLQFLEGEKRGKLFDKCPPKKVLIFRKRVDCWKNDIPPEGSGAVCYAWFVFQKGFKGKPEIDWL